MPDPIKLPPGAQLVEDSSSIKLPPGAELVSETPDISANDEGEGTYQMQGKGGILHVPYSHVETATKSGFTMTDADRNRYLKDAASDPKLKDLGLPKGVKAVGRNSAGQPILDSDNAQEGSAIGRFASSAGGAIVGAAKGLYHGVVEGAQNPMEAKEEELVGPLSMRALRLTVNPNVEQGKQAVESAQKGDVSEAVGHGIAAAVPFVGPWAAQVGEQVGQQTGAGNYAGAAGTVAGNAALTVAPKVAGKVVGIVPKAVRSTAEALTKTGPGELRKLAEETHQKNLDAIAAAKKLDAENAKEHLEKTQEALHKTQGAELETEAANKAAVDKAKADHEKATADTHAHNQRVVDKYRAEVGKITKENHEAEQAIQQRKEEEAKLQQETAEYYAKEDSVKKKAKDEENAAWKPWRDKIAGVQVDADPIVDTVEKFGVNSPEIKRMMSQLIPPPEDAPVTSQFYKDRQALIDQQGFNSPDLQYDQLNPNQRDIIDNLVKRLGLEPDPIDLELKKGEKVSLENIHRAKSIIGRNIASGHYEGPVLGEMKQVAKALDRAEKLGSNSVGALDDLVAAKAATVKYQEAFGRVRHVPITQDELFKKQANPEQYKEDEDQERLDAASKHDPSLVEAYEQVKAHREAIKKMKTEDQLRKAQKEIPPPPTVDDLREGYRLKPPPEPKEPEIKQPERTAPPDKPKDEVPEQKSITQEDLKRQRGESIQQFANRLREMGVRRALYTAATGLTGVLASFFLGHPGIWAAADVGAGTGVLVGSHALANLLEKPAVKEWLSKVSDKDVAQWEKLPPEQKAVFDKDMKAVAKAAKAKNVPMSPAFSAFVAGTAASQGTKPAKKDSPAELLQQAKDLHSQFQTSGMAPAQ